MICKSFTFQEPSSVVGVGRVGRMVLAVSLSFQKNSLLSEFQQKLFGVQGEATNLCCHAMFRILYSGCQCSYLGQFWTLYIRP